MNPQLNAHTHPARTLKKALTASCLMLFSILLMSVNSHGAAAPDWTLKDSNGKNVSLEDYRGKILILHFWATWCPYCKRVQPGLDKLYLEYKSQGVELLGISLREEEDADPQQSLIDDGHHFKTLLNGEKVAGLYQVSGTPTTYFIDRQGELIAVTNTSNPNDSGLREAIEHILKADQKP